MSPPVPSTILAFPSNHGNRLKVCTGKGREGVSGGGVCVCGGGGGGVCVCVWGGGGECVCVGGGCECVCVGGGGGGDHAQIVPHGGDGKRSPSLTR